MKQLFTLLTLLLYTTVFSQTYVFFGSYNHDKEKEGIYVYKLDTLSGNLNKVTAVAVKNPSYLTLSPDGKTLYACTDTKTPNAGSISSYSFNPQQKTLTFLNSQSSGGENPVYVAAHPSGKWVINGNYTESSISLFPVSANKSLKPAAQHFKYTEGSINPERQESSHIHSTVFSPDGNYVFFPDLGSDKIRCYKFDSKAKKPLTEKLSVQTVAGSGPRHLTFHPNGKFAYIIEELSGMVSSYTYFNSNLIPLQRIATHPEGLTEGFESSDVHISPDGKFLYASNRGKENNIAIFSIDNNGLLKNIGHQSTFGLHPRTFAIDPSGKFLIVSNVNSSNAVVFKRDLVTGLLTKTSETEIEHVSCVKIKQYQ